MITYDMNLFASSDHVQKRLVEMVRFLYIADTDNWHIAMHQHEEFCEWEYVVSGRGTYVIDSRIYPIQAGDLILINCGTGHEEKSEPTDPLISWKATCRMGPQGDLPAHVILPSGIEPVIHSGETGREVEECCENIRYELDKKIRSTRRETQNGFKAEIEKTDVQEENPVRTKTIAFSQH